MMRGLAKADETMVYRDSASGVGGFIEGAIYGDLSSNPRWEAKAGRFLSGFTTYGDARDLSTEYMAYRNTERGWGDALKFGAIFLITIVPGSFGSARKADPLDFVPTQGMSMRPLQGWNDNARHWDSPTTQVCESRTELPPC